MKKVYIKYTKICESVNVYFLVIYEFDTHNVETELARGFLIPEKF